MRGRKPNPSHLKLVKGNPGKRPVNRKEPKPKVALPSCPSHVTGPGAMEWRRVAKELYDIGVLSKIDRAALAAYCKAYGRWVQAENAINKMAKKDPITQGLLIRTSNGNPVQNPLVGIANKAQADMMKYAAEFGMTPSARSRIEVPGGEEIRPDADEYFN